MYFLGHLTEHLLAISSELQWFHVGSFAGNKVKGRNSKRVLQEKKAQQIFLKTNVSYPLIRLRTCAYQKIRNVRF